MEWCLKLGSRDTTKLQNQSPKYKVVAGGGHEAAAGTLALAPPLGCPICAASASSRSTLRPATMAYAQIVVRHGHGMADMSAASALLGATTAAFAATISRCAIPTARTSNARTSSAG